MGVTMAKINFDGAYVRFPLLTTKAKSVTNTIAELAIGGRVGKNAEGKNELAALTNLTLKISDGDRVGLIGHNGAGKSTFLRTVVGVYVPVEGKVEISGRIGSLVDLLIGVNAEASGAENIYTRAALLGIPKREITKIFREIVEFSGLGEFINMPIRTYSSGMLLRLAFSVATAVKSDILLMDEWLSVGDDDFRIKSEAKIQSMIEETNILILASHSRDLIERLCNKVLWLEHGQVKMFGSVEEVCNSYFGPPDA